MKDEKKRVVFAELPATTSLRLSRDGTGSRRYVLSRVELRAISWCSNGVGFLRHEEDSLMRRSVVLSVTAVLSLWLVALAASAKVFPHLVISGGQLSEPVRVEPDTYLRGAGGGVWGPRSQRPVLEGPAYLMVLEMPYTDQSGQPQVRIDGRWTYYPAAGGAIPDSGSAHWMIFAPGVNANLRQVISDRGGEVGELGPSYYEGALGGHPESPSETAMPLPTVLGATASAVLLVGGIIAVFRGIRRKPVGPAVP